MAPHLPRHGLTAEGVTSGIARGEKKTDLPTNPTWQIGLVLCYKPYRGGAGTAGGAKRPPRGVPRGVSPLGDSLVTFSSGRKSPGAWGGAPIHGECRGGTAPSHCQEVPRVPSMARPCSRGAPAYRGSQGPPSLQNSPGRGAKKKQKPQKGGCKKGEFVR